MKTRVWMNHWFSTAVNIIDLLRADGNDIHVIGTNEREFSVIRNSCDEWYKEPVLPDREYVDYCLKFCEDHHVDVFMPRRGMLKISEAKDRFAEIGVRVMLEDHEILSVLNNKKASYDYFASAGIAAVPDYVIVRTVAEFLEAYHTLAAQYGDVCFKFIQDEGGQSFRRIDAEKKGYLSLFKAQTTHMALSDAVAALSERETFAPVMVMPFLPGNEVSIDCLDTEDGLIALPRVKSYERYEIIEFNPEILDLCRRFQDTAHLQHPYNIQFKYRGGIPYFLEVNTRMSGGIQMACLASGVNIPQIALAKILGIRRPWTCSRETRKVAQVLQPIILR